MTGAGFVVWLTGLSGAGKSTLAGLLDVELRRRGHRVEVLDGDLIRTQLSKGLGYSKEDRDTNVRRVGFVCQLLSRNDVVAIAALISPYRNVRDEVRAACQGRFVEVYAKCPLDVLRQRDVKGLYEKALAGEIANFTGVSDPYEEPLNPDILLETDRESPTESAKRVIHKLEQFGYLSYPNGT